MAFSRPLAPGAKIEPFLMWPREWLFKIQEAPASSFSHLLHLTFRDIVEMEGRKPADRPGYLAFKFVPHEESRAISRRYTKGPKKRRGNVPVEEIERSLRAWEGLGAVTLLGDDEVGFERSLASDLLTVFTETPANPFAREYPLVDARNIGLGYRLLSALHVSTFYERPREEEAVLYVCNQLRTETFRSWSKSGETLHMDGKTLKKVFTRDGFKSLIALKRGPAGRETPVVGEYLERLLQGAEAAREPSERPDPEKAREEVLKNLQTR